MTTVLRVNTPKILVFLTLLVTVCFFATGVQALESTKSSTPRKDLIQQKIDNKKVIAQGRIENLREKIASREAALKTKLQTFRNRVKANTADRVNTNLNKINLNQTTQMQNHLTRMSQILAKLETRVGSNSSIASASAAIASASAAVSTQAGNDYTISVTSESTIKKDAQEARNKLHTDLQAVRKIVIEAKQAVANAIRISVSGKL